MAELILPSGAIKVIQTQQNMVGSAIVGGAGSVTNNVSNSDNTPVVGVLEQIREISLKSFKGITRVATLLADTLNFEKANARRERDQAAELAKESKRAGSNFIGPMPKDGGGGEDEGGSGLGAKGGFLAGLGLQPLLAQAKNILAKIVKPFKKLLTALSRLTPLAGTLTRLAPLLAPLGPIGAIIGGLFLLVQYSDEIAKALSPVLDKMKQAFETLSPLIGFITEIADTVVKQAIVSIGSGLSVLGDVLTGVADLIGGIFSTVKTLFTGAYQLITGEITLMDFGKMIWEDGIKKILMAPINMLQNLGKTIFDFIKGLVKSLPFGLGDKILGGMKGMAEGDQSGTAGDMAGEASMMNAATTTNTQTTPDSQKSLFTSGGAYKAEVTPKEKPKTINIDKTTGVTQVAEKVMKAEPAEYTTEQREKDIKSLEAFLSGSYSKRKNNLLSDLEAAGISGPISRTGVDSVSGVDFDKKNAELLEKAKAAGMGFEFEQALMMSLRLREANLAKSDLQMGMPDRPEIMKVFDEANAIKPRVRTTGETLTAKGGQGNVTIVNNQPQNISSSTNVAKTSVSQGSINTSSGDNYFDRQAYNAIV